MRGGGFGSGGSKNMKGFGSGLKGSDGGGASNGYGDKGGRGDQGKSRAVLSGSVACFLRLVLGLLGLTIPLNCLNSFNTSPRCLMR